MYTSPNENFYLDKHFTFFSKFLGGLQPFRPNRQAARDCALLCAFVLMDPDGTMLIRKLCRLTYSKPHEYHSVTNTKLYLNVESF